MIEDALRQALAAEANSVEVAPDALTTIRTRIARRRWWVRLLPTGPALFGLAGGTAVLAAAVATAVVLAGAPPRSAPTQPPAGQANPGPSAATSSPAAPSGPTANLPVYYLGATSAGPRLYREYQVLPVTSDGAADRTLAALKAMAGTPGPADPDYTTAWRGTTFNDVRVGGLTAYVDLHHAPDLDATTGPMALQQLVWTVTAVSGAPAVRLQVDGGPVHSLGAVSGLDDVLARAPRTTVQAPVWLIDPQQGAAVSRTFDVHVAATAPDGTVRIRVTSGGQVVLDKVMNLGVSAPEQGEGHLQVTLQPGRYTVSAYLQDPTQDADNHDITIN